MKYVAAFAIALAVYLSNGETISSYDAMPNSLLVVHALADHRLDFDVLRNGPYTKIGGQYALVEAPAGHLTSLFPVGTAIVTAPVYATLYALRAASGQVTDIASPGFEPVRLADEKVAAAIVAALAVALFFACASTIAGLPVAALATVAFAFGTETWMIGSQGLWQHGSVELVLLAMIGALLQGSRTENAVLRTRWLFVAGACMGLLPVVRPTALVFSIAGAIFAAMWFERRALGAVAAGALLGLAPGIAWNLSFFHSLAGGYAGNAPVDRALGRRRRGSTRRSPRQPEPRDSHLHAAAHRERVRVCAGATRTHRAGTSAGPLSARVTRPRRPLRVLHRLARR